MSKQYGGRDDCESKCRKTEGAAVRVRSDSSCKFDRKSQRDNLECGTNPDVHKLPAP